MLFKLSILAFSLLSVFTTVGAQTIKRIDGTAIAIKKLDERISELIKNAEVHGLAISIFNDNKAVYKKTFGFKNAETGDTLATTTNLYGASLSKAVFAVLVMQLVQEGVVDLDRPLQTYLDKPIYEYKPLTRWHDNYQDLKTDSLYSKITARMCLSHTTGFSNWRWDEKDQKLRVNFQPGSKYGYSGEGMVYLQVVLEKLLGKPLEQLMKERIFSPLKMSQSAYSWKPEFEADYAIGHTESGKLFEKDKDNEPRSASTLETTLDDYTLFTEAVLNNRLITAETRVKMFTPQIRLRSVQQFGPLRFRDSTLNDHISLSAGLGWILLKSPYGIAAFKEGHGDGFQHYTILFPEKKTGIVIMTNSDNGESIFKELLETAIGDRFTPWYWENYIPYQLKSK